MAPAALQAPAQPPAARHAARLLIVFEFVGAGLAAKVCRCRIVPLRQLANPLRLCVRGVSLWCPYGVRGVSACALAHIQRRPALAAVAVANCGKLQSANKGWGRGAAAGQAAASGPRWPSARPKPRTRRAAVWGSVPVCPYGGLMVSLWCPRCVRIAAMQRKDKRGARLMSAGVVCASFGRQPMRTRSRAARPKVPPNGHIDASRKEKKRAAERCGPAFFCSWKIAGGCAGACRAAGAIAAERQQHPARGQNGENGGEWEGKGKGRQYTGPKSAEMNRRLAGPKSADKLKSLQTTARSQPKVRAI